MKFEEAEKAAGYTFKDKELLKRAFTLSSYSRTQNNQTLEFFGDAILEFIVSERIFSESGSEGALTDRRKSIVSDTALTPVSEKLGLDKLLLRGKNDTGNKKAVPSAYEALVAAIYLDGGMDEARRFVLSTLDFSPREEVNFKGKLQEYLQSFGKPCPEYGREDIGTERSHKFKATLRLFGKKFEGVADRAADAEQLAAEAALKFIESNETGNV